MLPLRLTLLLLNGILIKVVKVEFQIGMKPGGLDHNMSVSTKMQNFKHAHKKPNNTAT